MDLGPPVSECLHVLDFIGAKDGGGGGTNWSCKKCKAPVKLSTSTNQHCFFTGWMPCLSPDQQYHIPSTWSAQAHLGVIQPCLWPLKAPGYLGEHCQASHQLSDDSTPACLKHYHPYNFTRGKAQWMSSQRDDLVQKTLKIQISLEIIFTSSFFQKFSAQKISVKSDRNL